VSGAQRFILLGAVPLGTASAGHVIALMGAQATAWSVAIAMAVLALIAPLLRLHPALRWRNRPEGARHPREPTGSQGLPAHQPGLAPVE
jgi:hypothetical protein